MNRLTSAVMTGVVVDTLEKMAFLFALPGEEGTPERVVADPLETAEVSFCGPCSGRMQFGLSASVMTELAANMLGSEDSADVSIEKQRDALRELANVICGNLLPAIGGREAEYSIGTPRIVGAARATLGSAAVESRLTVEGGVCRVAIELAECPPGGPDVGWAQSGKGRMG
ncbi:MAG: chemotaxis protein CheX [Desulfobacterales bacterium]